MPRLLAAAILGLMLLVGNARATAIAVPPLTTRVIDQAAVLSSDDAQALEGKLAAFEQGNGGQIAVLIVPTTGDETIEQFSIRVVDQWKLGRKGVDDGVLVLVAKDDRTVRIEVGRGYEGALPDAVANRIIDGFITPKFLAGDYAGGLNDGVDRIIDVVNGGALPEPAKVVVSAPAAEPAAAAAPIPPLTGHVVNQTDLITYAQALYLDRKLGLFEADKRRKIALLLVSNIGDESCDDYAQRVFRAWKLSSDGIRDDGVLIAECEEPYGDRIVVGRDLQGTITPAIAERIHYEDMSLKMIGGDYVGGFAAGIDQIIDLENGKPMPVAKPEDSSDWGSASDWFVPPPFGTWTVSFVAVVFAFFIPAAVLGYKSALLRGSVTALLVGLVLLIAGSGIAFLLCFALPAAFLSAKYAQEEGPEPPFYPEPNDRSRRVSVSGWSILGSLAGMAISSGGGGGGGFRGGGGGFSGGGASGRW